MKFFKIFVKESLLIIFLFCSLSSFAQENSVTDFKQKLYQDFKAAIHFEDIYVKTLEKLNFNSESKKIIFKEHLKILFSSDLLVEKFWEQFSPFLKPPSSYNETEVNQIVKDATLIGMSFIEDLAVKGMLRLNDSDRLEYFIQTYEVTDLMDDRTCASFQFGNEFIDPDVLRNFAVDYYNSLSDIAVRHKLALVRKAVFAEINNYHLPKFISSNDLYLAEQAMVSALDNWAKGISEDKVQNFALVLTNPGAFSYADQCSVAKTFLEILISIDGKYGDINRIQILQSLVH